MDNTDKKLKKSKSNESNNVNFDDKISESDQKKKKKKSTPKKTSKKNTIERKSSIDDKISDSEQKKKNESDGEPIETYSNSKQYVQEINLSSLEESFDSDISYRLNNFDFDDASPDTVDEMKIACIKKKPSRLFDSYNDSIIRNTTRLDYNKSSRNIDNIRSPRNISPRNIDNIRSPRSLGNHVSYENSKDSPKTYIMTPNTLNRSTDSKLGKSIPTGLEKSISKNIKKRKVSKNINDKDLSNILDNENNENNSSSNKNPKKNINSLDKLVEAIYGAVLKSSSTVQKSSLFFLHNYFTYDEETDAFEPKTLKIKLSDNSMIDVPLFTLVKHTHLEIDRFKVNLNVHLDTSSIQKGNRTTDGKYVITTKALSGHKKDVTNIEIEFKRSEPTETISRLGDKYQPFT